MAGGQVAGLAGRLLRSGRFVSLAILFAGAASVFVANVLARRTLPEADFVEWAYLTSIVSIFFSFSLLGTEQLIIRSADVSLSRIRVPVNALRAILAAGVTFGLGWVLLADGRVFSYRLGGAAVVVWFAVGAIQVAYQGLRTQGELVRAQVALNLWKILLLPALLVIPHTASVGSVALWVTIVALVVGAAPALDAIRSLWSRLEVAPADHTGRVVILPFVVSLGTLALLNSLDRIVIERVAGAAVFAEYFYLLTVLVTPFGILASHTGFREAVRYRKEYRRSQVMYDAARAAAVAAALALLWSVMCFLFRERLGVRFDLSLWALLCLLATIRNAYAIASAALGVRGEANAIVRANVATFVAMAGLVAAALVVRPSVEMLVGGYCVMWMVRLASYLAAMPPTHLASKASVAPPVVGESA